MAALARARYYYFPATRSTLLPSFRHGHYVTLRMYACLSQNGVYLPPVNNKCTHSAAPIIGGVASAAAARPPIISASARTGRQGREYAALATPCTRRLHTPQKQPRSRSTPCMERARGQNTYALSSMLVGTASEKLFNNISQMKFVYITIAS
jgi:hypothetical protein